MYGRRRRAPLLGAAMVVGTSHVAANRAVNAAQQKDAAARQSEELKRSEYERQQADVKYKEDKAAWERERVETKAKEERAAWEREMAEGKKPVNVARQELGDNRKFCGNCGSPYKLGANFCIGCGTKLI